MEVLKAQAADLDAIEQIYDHIHEEEEKGAAVIGWDRNVYPVRKTAEQALQRDDLFVMKDEEKVVAAAIINQTEVPEYKNASWKHEAKENGVMVLHTLVVEPKAGKHGYGKAFVAFYEEYAKKNGCRELRMDTNVINQRARRMYHQLGYEEIGIVGCVFNGIPDVKLVCLEKYLG